MLDTLWTRPVGRVLVLSLLILGFAAGCKHQKKINYNQELPPGWLALRKISPAEYPDFSRQMTDPAALVRSADYSIKYLSTASSRKYFPYLDISHERALATVVAFKEMVGRYGQRSPLDGPAFNSEICQKFEVYKSWGAPKPDGPGFTDQVLFTGYCTPIYKASLTRGGPYQYPLYKKPADLLSDPATGQVYGRKTDAGIMPRYYTRQEIEGEGKLAGQELVWLTSRWEAYVVSIQGSGRLQLPDGRIYEVGYAGFNGYDYTSPGERMVADGVITKEEHTGRGIRSYFQAHPEAMDKYLFLNQRFIFFTETHGGPFGSLGQPVTPWASIAVDKKPEPARNIYPRAMPAFLTVPIPTDEMGGTRDFRGFLMDQDTGGAIRAAGRCDIYMGVGPQAERLASQQLQSGELYYIAVKPELIPQFAKPSLARAD